MPEVGDRARMGLAQFLEEIIEAIPVVFKFVVIATKMTEFEELEKGRVVDLGNRWGADVFDRERHPFEEIGMPAMFGEKYLAFKDADEFSFFFHEPVCPSA